MLERIYIKDLTIKLNCKDIRSVKNWCNKNDVAILCDIGSNKRYVIKEEFEAKYMKQSVQYIQQKYGKSKLPEFLQSTMNFFSEYQQAKSHQKSEYKPKGQNEMEFLSILQNLNPTL